MFKVSIAGFNTGGGNVNFKGFANHVYRFPHEQYGYQSAARYSLIRQQLLHIHNSREGSPHNALHLPSNLTSMGSIHIATKMVIKQMEALQTALKQIAN